MNAKEALGDARWSRVRLDALLERRRWCMQMSDYRSGGGSQALEKLQREVDARIDAEARRAAEAMGHIDALPDPGQRAVMAYRYLNGLSWKEIARRMNFSQDWVKHVHGRALREMEKISDIEMFTDTQREVKREKGTGNRKSCARKETHKKEETLTR